MWTQLSKQLSPLFRVTSFLLLVSLLTTATILPIHAATTTSTGVDTSETISSANPTTTASTTIGTGDTISNTDIFTDTNTNTVETVLGSQVSATATEVALEEASTTLSEIPASSSSASLPATHLSIENQATSTTNSTTTATTGDNHTNSDAGLSSSNTGDALAIANVVNLINTNSINSTGMFAFLYQLFGTIALDVRSLFTVFESPDYNTTELCSQLGCEITPLEYHSTNSAVIINNVSVVADTGNNTAHGDQAIIDTGNAYALANVTNLANTNLIDAQYLLLTFSNFGDLFGDIIFPGKELLERLFSLAHSPAADNQLFITNQSTVTNAVSTEAISGQNTASADVAAISTGNTNSYSSVFNQTNHNAIDSDSVTLLIRVHGDWDGEVFGLPTGFNWQRTSEGIMITTNTGVSSNGLLNENHFIINNDATINNNISVSATTGNNKAVGSSTATISTGNAFAASNVQNITNTNILGRNWSLLIFDIFGNWRGNVSFGQTDLWLGGSAQAPREAARPGDTIKYTFTISNLGDLAATNVVLDGTMTSNLITLNTPLHLLPLGTIQPGETITHTITGTVAASLPAGSQAVDLEAQVTSREPDANTENNREVITVLTERRSSGGGSGTVSKRTDPADIVIDKSVLNDALTAGATTTYTINLTNNGGPLFGALLEDTLYGPDGEVVAIQRWPLDTINPKETITITYDTNFTTSSSDGTYLNRAQLLGYHKNTNPKRMELYSSPLATVPTIIGTSTPLVLGIATSTATSCSPYLEEYLRYGSNNSSTEVEKLQTFLDQYFGLDRTPSRIFDRDTEAAVKRFQTEYTADILKPWGITTATGYVYYTTQKKINELYCGNNQSFPLSATQVKEIARSRLTTGGLARSTTPVSSPPEPTAVMATNPSSEANRSHRPFLIPAAEAASQIPVTLLPNIIENAYTWVANRIKDLFTW